MSTLTEAIRIALAAHDGQKDKSGQPYILHPLHLMSQMETIEEKIVAVLHDALEDAEDESIIDEFYKMNFSGRVIMAVEALTRAKNESYDAFIERIAVNELATKIKIKDLEHNMDVRRLREVTEVDRKRLNKYLRAWNRLKYGN